MDENGEDYSSYESEDESDNDSLTGDHNDTEVCKVLNIFFNMLVSTCFNF